MSQSKLIMIVSGILMYLTSSAESKEILTVKHYDNLIESLQPSVASRINNNKRDIGNYVSFNAGNNGSISFKKQKSNAAEFLATHTFENTYATNASSLPGPADKNTVYELLSSKDSKEYFSEVTFLDSNTIVTISYTKKNVWLLLVDISTQPMQVTSRLSIPIFANGLSLFSRNKDKFYVNPETHQIILPVNKTAETIDKSGNLSWKKSKSHTPGVWIISPVKNDEKKWVLDKSGISVNYFSNELLKGKNALYIQTAHSDINGNIWMSFTNGIAGVLPLINEKSYGTQVILHNFNKDVAMYNDVQKKYTDILTANLIGTVDNANDSTNLQNAIYNHPQSYGQQYLESARYTIFSNLLKEKNRTLDSNSYYSNSEELLKYIHVDLDNPLSKKKGKLVNYFGYKVRRFQTIQNGITMGNDNSVYMTTNLGLHKLSYNEKTNDITVKWSLSYTNSFIRSEAQKTASSGTTPVFMEDRNEVAICDNDFPQVNMLVIDAQTGSIQYKFRLFENGYGSYCENAVAYCNHSIVIGNTFGNGSQLKDKDDIPANGIMKFNCNSLGHWRVDYDWNKLQYYTTTNTSVPKISAADQRLYIYHQPDENKEWQISSIPLNKADKFNPILYSLQPDFKGIIKTDLNNFRSNYTFGPNKTIIIGTSGGLLRVKSE